MGNSMTNVSISSQTNNTHHGSGLSSFLASSTHNITSLTTSQINGSSQSTANSQYVFLFTSDFERNAWLEEMNSAIFACKIYLHTQDLLLNNTIKATTRLTRYRNFNPLFPFQVHGKSTMEI